MDDNEILEKFSAMQKKFESMELELSAHKEKNSDSYKSQLEERDRQLAEARHQVEELRAAFSLERDAMELRVLGMEKREALLDARQSLGILPEMYHAFDSLIGSKIEIRKIDGSNGEGDSYSRMIEGIPVSEYLDSWVQTAEAEHFLAASSSSGDIVGHHPMRFITASTSKASVSNRERMTKALESKNKK